MRREAVGRPPEAEEETIVLLVAIIADNSKPIPRLPEAW